ncbi:MAG: restriction endonuclease subunit S [Spirochaetes bacterium]|nr:restriction endonuclease subunit S [Spirochaetota bacterium]
MSEWQEYKLEDIALINPAESIAKGLAAKKIAMECLKPFTKKVSGFSIEPFNGGTKFRNGDTIIARITPCLENGKTAYVDVLDSGEIGFGSTEYIVLREKADLSDKHYLYYFSISPEFRDVAILAMTGSSGRQRVEMDVVKNHTFLLPPLPEQRAIAEVLSNLDDKIDLLHRQNKTLEAMAETLFRQWFVEEAQDVWGEVSLSYFVDIKYGKDHKHLFDGNIPVYGSGGIMRFAETALYNKESVLIPRKGTLGNVFYINKPFWTVDTMFYTIMKQPHIAKFIYFFVKNLDLVSMNVGSAVPSMTTEVLNNLPLIKPPEEYLKKFENITDSIFEKIEHNNIQIHTLEKLRDTLLPKLMSGEVRVGA